MSRSSEYVDWCLKKAKKEIDECKKQGKRSLDEKFIEALEYEEDSVIELRESYTYGVQITVKDEGKINVLKELCKELIDITKEIIFI